MLIKPCEVYRRVSAGLSFVNLSFLCILFLCSQVQAQTQTQTQSPEKALEKVIEEEATLSPSFIWRVSNAEQSFLLGGTIHLLSQSDFPLPPAFDRAYAESQSLVLEMDLAEQSSPEFQQLSIKYMFLPQGESVFDSLDKPAKKQLKKWLAENNLNKSQIKPMRPSMLSLFVSITELAKINMHMAGVDQFYYDKAMADQRAIMGLESSEQQLQFLAKMGEENPSQLILQTLEDASKIAPLMDTLKAAWRNGDAQAMHRLMVEDMQRDYPDIYEQLLVERNHQWLPLLEQELDDEGQELVLVGAAHLVGEDGLLQLLAAKGYQIELYH